jgi:hypothetical protein
MVREKGAIQNKGQSEIAIKNIVNTFGKNRKK